MRVSDEQEIDYEQVRGRGLGYKPRRHIGYIVFDFLYPLLVAAICLLIAARYYGVRIEDARNIQLPGLLLALLHKFGL